jgi:hypothetical protein
MICLCGKCRNAKQPYLCGRGCFICFANKRCRLEQNACAVRGGLIGGASLKAADFRYTNKVAAQQTLCSPLF